jgi:parallel beta-helix repeat protein
VVVSGIYEDGDAQGVTGDGSTDYVDVAYFGSDYVVFRAGTYFQDGDEHELKIQVEGNTEYASGEYWRMTPVGWVIGYSTNDALLQTHPEHVVFIEPVTFSPSTTLGTVTTARPIIVTDFGRSIKAVVLAISAVTPYPFNVTNAFNRFFYEYEYGVFTPATANVAWSGTVLVNADRTVPAGKTLTLQPGTRVRVATVDRTPGGANAQKIEFNAEGALIADGTSTNPIVFESWTPTTTEDWVGFYFDSLSVGGTFDNCHISRAEIAIESYVNLTVKNSTFEDCRYSGVTGHNGSALVQGCTFSDPGTWGIFLTAADATVRNTIVDNAVSAAVHVQPNATLAARNSQFLNSDKGLYVSGNTTVNVDSTCGFNSNAIGIYCYNTGMTPVIKNSTINSNTDDGVNCYYSSHPLIQGNTIRYNVQAIYCNSASSPTIQANLIKSNTHGITTMEGSNPDIGEYPSTGGNTIAFTTNYHVVNFDESLTLLGQNNCWNDNSPPCGPKASKIMGLVDTSDPICCSVSASSPSEPLPEPEAAPLTETGLIAVVPNPFNPSTTIHYSLAAQSGVSIAIYDVAGRLVRELVNRTEPAGAHRANWEGVDARGAPVASGVYFVKMSAGTYSGTMKMVLLK